jgi:hypothetical protein
MMKDLTLALASIASSAFADKASIKAPTDGIAINAARFLCSASFDSAPLRGSPRRI